MKSGDAILDLDEAEDDLLLIDPKEDEAWETEPLPDDDRKPVIREGK